MGLIDRPRYSFPISSTLQATPAASTTYYISNIASTPGVTSGTGALFVPMSGTILYVNLIILCTIPGTAQQGTISVRINSANDFLVSNTVLWNGNRNIVFNDPFSSPVMTGEVSGKDVWEIKIETPAWVTPPQGVIYNGSITFGNIY